MPTSSSTRIDDPALTPIGTIGAIANLQCQHQPASPGTRTATHHPLPRFAFAMRQHPVAMIDVAGQHADLAGAAQPFLAVALHVHVGSMQDFEHRLVGWHLQGQSGSRQLDLEGAFVRRIEGDPANVIGLGIPLLRDMVRRAGLSWPDLWT